MKKIFLSLAVALMLSLVLMSCVDSYAGSPREQMEAASQSVSEKAINTIPVPDLNYFQERRTIQKWAEFWDKPALPAYVYLFLFDKCIGYFVSDGKPASTRSYITPEERLERFSYGGSYYTEIVSAPDIDGTWGDNNGGIRFFTASGNPVEFGGAAASYLYSAFPLPLNVPKLEALPAK